MGPTLGIAIAPRPTRQPPRPPRMPRSRRPVATPESACVRLLCHPLDGGSYVRRPNADRVCQTPSPLSASIILRASSGSRLRLAPPHYCSSVAIARITSSNPDRSRLSQARPYTQSRSLIIYNRVRRNHNCARIASASDTGPFSYARALIEAGVQYVIAFSGDAEAVWLMEQVVRRNSCVVPATRGACAGSRRITNGSRLKDTVYRHTNKISIHLAAR
jgi:hypothetical protein